MYTREILSSETYTLAEARRIIKAEESRKREMAMAKAKQIALGMLCLLLCLLIPFACDGDCTVWFVLIPCAIYFFKGIKEEEE